jgi:hypothetical protein
VKEYGTVMVAVVSQTHNSPLDVFTLDEWLTELLLIIKFALRSMLFDLFLVAGAGC